jgi:hypothetical protein
VLVVGELDVIQVLLIVPENGNLGVGLAPDRDHEVPPDVILLCGDGIIHVFIIQRQSDVSYPIGLADGLVGVGGSALDAFADGDGEMVLSGGVQVHFQGVGVTVVVKVKVIPLIGKDICVCGMRP